MANTNKMSASMDQFHSENIANQLKNASTMEAKNAILDSLGKNKENLYEVFKKLEQDSRANPADNATSNAVAHMRVYWARTFKEALTNYVHVQTEQAHATLDNVQRTTKNPETKREAEQIRELFDNKQTAITENTRNNNTSHKNGVDADVRKRGGKATLPAQKYAADGDSGEVTAPEQGVARSASARTTTKFQNQKVLAEYRNGELTAQSMVDLISDLDDMSGVEVYNRGILRRALFGGGKQKEIIGEAQLQHALKGKSKAQLDELFGRLVGSGGLPWNGAKKVNMNNENYGDTPASVRTVFDLDGGERIRALRNAIIEQADVMADLSAILMPGEGNNARAGLIAVIEPGGKERFQAYLQDPANQQKLADAIAKAETLDRGANIGEKIVSTLVRAGIMVPVTVLSKGTIGGYIEAAPLDSTKAGGRFSASLSNVSGKMGIGESGSVQASLDLVGARIEANWNDPHARISNRTAAMRDVAEHGDAVAVQTAMKQLVDKVNSEVVWKKYATAVARMGEQFKNAQAPLINLQNLSPAQRAQQIDAFVNNTMMYLSRVEQAKGMQLKGAFAAYSAGKWFLGLSSAITDRSGNFDKLSKAGAVAEADALRGGIDAQREQELLAQAKIPRTADGGYIVDGKLVKAGPGEKVIFHFTDISTDAKADFDVRAEVVPANAPTASTLIDLRNTNEVDAYVEKNTASIANVAKTLRSSYPTRMRTFHSHMTNEDYSAAANELRTIFGSMKSAPKGLMTHFNSLKWEDLRVFLQDIERLSSGSNKSRELADKMMAGANITNEVDKMYDTGLAQAFGRIYGVGKGPIYNQFQQMKGSIHAGSVRGLGQAFPEGFVGMVSYSQVDGKGKSVQSRAAKIMNNRAQIVGNPAEVTDGALLNGVKNQLKNTMRGEIAHIRTQINATAGVNLSDAEVQALMIDGIVPDALQKMGIRVSEKPKIHSYLSFEDHAECFNIGFVLQPIKLVVPEGNALTSSFGAGSVVGRGESNVLTIGLGIGWTPRKKPQPPEDTGTETGTETPTETGTETGTETPTETGTETGTETPTETGTETPTETPTETGTETPTETPTETTPDIIDPPTPPSPPPTPPTPPSPPPRPRVEYTRPDVGDMSPPTNVKPVAPINTDLGEKLKKI